MTKYSIGTGSMICVCAAQGFIKSPTGDKGLQPCNDHEVGIDLSIFRCFDLSAEFIHVCQRLIFSSYKRVRFWKKLVFYTNRRDVALFQFLNKPAHVVEIAVSSITVKQNGNSSSIAHEFEHIQHL